MKTEFMTNRANVSPIVRFGDVERQSAFIYLGVLYVKTASNTARYIPDSGSIVNFTDVAIVTPVKKVTISYEV